MNRKQFYEKRRAYRILRRQDDDECYPSRHTPYVDGMWDFEPREGWRTSHFWLPKERRHGTVQEYFNWLGSSPYRLDYVRRELQRY